MAKIVLGVFLCFVGCNQTMPPEPPSPKTLLDILNPEVDSIGTHNEDEQTENLPLSIYIDTSESMRGFVASPNSKYCQTIQQVLSNTLSASYNVSYFRFSQTIDKVGRRDFSRSTRPDFYSGSVTPLAELLMHISDDEQSPLVIIVTDMVQSTSDSDEFSLQVAFRNMARKYPEILVLGSKSSFDGKYFSEVGSGRYPLNYTADSTGRPFYILVFAPSKKVMQVFQNYVFTNFKMDRKFSPSDLPIKVRKIKLASVSRDFWTTSKSSTLYHRPNSSWEEPDSVFVSWFRMIKTPKVGHIDLDLTYQIEQYIPQHVSRFIFSCAAVDKDTIDLLSNVRTHVSNKTDSSLTVNFPLPRLKPQSWDSYYITMRPEEGSLQLPEWITEWSTNDDTDPLNGDRTLHLERCMMTMLRNITEKRVIIEQFISIGRGH